MLLTCPTTASANLCSTLNSGLTLFAGFGVDSLLMPAFPRAQYLTTTSQFEPSNTCRLESLTGEITSVELVTGVLTPIFALVQVVPVLRKLKLEHRQLSIGTSLQRSPGLAYLLRVPRHARVKPHRLGLRQRIQSLLVL